MDSSKSDDVDPLTREWNELYRNKIVKPKEEEIKMKKALAAVFGAWLLVTVLVSGFIAIVWAVVAALQAIFS